MGELAATANEAVLDRGVRHAVFLQRYKTGVVNELMGKLNAEVLPDALERLRTRLARIASRGADAGPWTTQRFRDVLGGLDKTLGAGLHDLGSDARAELAELAMTEAEWQARAIGDALPRGLEIDLDLPTAGQLRSIVTSRPMQGQVFSQWWGRVGRQAKVDIARQLRIGLAEGETTDQIVRRISGTSAGRYMDGVFGGPRRDVESTVRTGANHVAAQAREELYKANDDVVKGVQLVATLDGRTTETCMAQDGKVYPVGEGPRPPFHYQCRSSTIPVLKSWKELGIKLQEAPPGTRASMGGQVPAKTTYGQWLRKQPRAVQDDVLGPRRAALFRSGAVKIDRFVDARGRKLTLAELRVKEGLAKPPVVAPPAPVPERPSIPEYVPARTLTDAADNLSESMPGVQVSLESIQEKRWFKSIVKDRVNRANEDILRMRRQFPGFNKWINTQGTLRQVLISGEPFLLREGQSMDGYFNYISKTLGMAQCRRARTGLLRFGKAMHTVSAGGFDSVWRHEIGHGVRQSLSEGLRRAWGDIFERNPASWWTNNISRYSAKSESEAFSECLAAYTHAEYKVSTRLPAFIEEFFDEVMK